MYKIFDTCYISSDIESKLCIHYTLRDKYDHPTLRFCTHNLNGDVRLTSNAAYQRYPNSSDFDDGDVIESPNVISTPIVEHRPIIKTDMYDRSKLLELIDNMDALDCSGVYIRDIDTLDEIQVLYENPDNIESRYRHRQKYNINNLELVAHELKDNEELAVVMTLSDYYIRHVHDVYMVIDIRKKNDK